MLPSPISSGRPSDPDGRQRGQCNDAGGEASTHGRSLGLAGQTRRSPRGRPVLIPA
jgi:hypothetical protein